MSKHIWTPRRADRPGHDVVEFVCTCGVVAGFCLRTSPCDCRPRAVSATVPPADADRFVDACSNDDEAAILRAAVDKVRTDPAVNQLSVETRAAIARVEVKR